MEKKYWKGMEELSNDAEFVKHKHNEFAEHLPIEDAFGDKLKTTTPRRDFLKFLGFGIATASLAACEAPINKTIPYLINPEEIVPGVANWYASTFADGNDYCSIVVKTREGRPIKIEGNTLSKVTKGGTNARVQASVLSLYDSARLKGPMASGVLTSWDNIDKLITDKLKGIASDKKNIRILSSTIISPSTKKVIADFIAKYPTTKHITHDAVSYSAMVTANQESFGASVIPTYNFDKANIVVSFGADFLVNWISPIEHANQYIQNRKLSGKKNMSRHIQFESILSVTGSNADLRIPIKPSHEAATLLSLYNKLSGDTSNTSSLPHGAKIEAVAKELWNNKGKALVVSGTNDVQVQNLVNAINSILDSYGNTIDLSTPYYLKQGNDKAVMDLMEEMDKGEVGALILYNTNPVYTLPRGEQFKKALNKVELKISFADRVDETADVRGFFICPDSHYLESWNDAEPKKGHFSLAQPTIAPIFQTRQAQESLLRWSGNTTNYHAYIQNYWKENIFPHQNKLLSFDSFWVQALQDGVFEVTSTQTTKAYKLNPSVISALQTKGSDYRIDGIELIIYEKAGLGNGNQANNPWLQELPDPVSKITWDNYLTMSPADMEGKFSMLLTGDREADLVEITANGVTKKVPVYPQPGQAQGTIGLAFGYGRTNCGKAGNGVGVNAYPFASFVNGNIQRVAYGVKISEPKGKYALAATQTHHTMMGRAILKETTLDRYVVDPKSGNPPVLIPTHEGPKKSTEVNLWDSHQKPNHLWGMAIDLNSCIGCGACVIGCQSENNIPVVGKEEVMRSREMHWIRIDRYYSSDAEEKDLRGLEVASKNPEVAFQPVMCQHCNHAPCETVCPVAATTHSSDGLNQMAYNRCVGTRYCANNCPYKVRRFNWFKYSDNEQFDFNMNNDLGKMVLNPDVVVRSRGVMEKCSLCVQRIQEGRLNAKKENRPIKDGEINTACAQACPTNAIVFGDYNDSDSRVSQLSKEERSYHLLEEIDTQPNVFYQTKVRNKT